MRPPRSTPSSGRGGGRGASRFASIRGGLGPGTLFGSGGSPSRTSFLEMATLVFVLAYLLMCVTVTSEKTKTQEEEDRDFDNELNITSKEKILVRRLISRYERQGKEGRPVVNTSDAVRVNFGLSLIQILDVDVKNQILKTNIWYEYTWTDVLLRWDPKAYDNIDKIRIPSDKIWLPDIVLYNFADDRLKEQRSALAVISSDGGVLWMPQAILRSSCAFDILLFPLDEQTCLLKFGSWTYNGFKLDLFFKNGTEKFDFGDYIPNNEWVVVENEGYRNVKMYTCCPEPYPDLKFKLRLKRRVAFYAFILIMPCALLSLLTMVIFWVPPESPAKLTLGINVFVAFFVLLLLLADSTPKAASTIPLIGMNVFVAFFVLLLLLADSLPKAASTIPLIGMYFCMNMIMITLSEMLACMVANMHFRGVRINRVPKCLRSFIFDFMSRVMCVRDIVLEKDTSSSVLGPGAGPGMAPKKRWNAGRVGGDTRPQYPYTDMSFAQVRLLDNGVEKRDQGFDGGVEGRGHGFQFPPIGDEYLAHSQANAQVLEEIRNIREILERVRDKKTRMEEKDKLFREWRMVALVTDRMLFTFYVMVNCVGLFILVMWQLSYKPVPKETEKWDF